MRQAASVMTATRRFCHAPVGYTEELAKDEMPVESRLKPIVVTTHAETIGLTKRRQYFAVMPRRPSMQPPTTTAPIIRP